MVKEVIPGAQIEIGSGLTEFEKSDTKKRGQISIEKAKEQLGFISKYDLRRGIEDYVNMYHGFSSKKKPGRWEAWKSNYFTVQDAGCAKYGVPLPMKVL